MTPMSGYAVFARIFWMFMGPMILTIVTINIVSQGGGWITASNRTFFAVLGVMLLSRWAEFHAGNPRTANGDPAAPGHLRRYILGASAAGLVIWIIANAIAALE